MMIRKDQQTITIRPIKMEDYETILKWSKDEAFCLANEWELNRDQEELYHWWHRCVHNDAEDFIRMGIEYDGILIGYGDLAFIKGNTAEIGIAIGESSLWGKGIGTNALKSLIEYASKELGITVFNAETHETNHRSKRMLEKVGFKEVSIIGSEVYKGTESQLIQYKYYWHEKVKNN